jgi:ABC-type arginine transport system permease subunit
VLVVDAITSETMLVLIGLGFALPKTPLYAATETAMTAATAAVPASKRIVVVTSIYYQESDALSFEM